MEKKPTPMWWFARIFAVALLGTSGSASGQSAAGGATGKGVACRTYSTSESRTIGSNIGSGSMKLTCEYNKSTNEHVCHSDYADSRTAYSSVITYKFASVDDFISDAPRIVHFGRATTVTIRITTPGLASMTTSTQSFDAQGRLTRITSRLAEKVVAEQRFTAWDQFGRPTAATDGTQAYTYAYKDTERVVTATNVTARMVTRSDGPMDAERSLLVQEAKIGRTDDLETARIRSPLTLLRCSSILKGC
jgi:YD repeat-containing protein